MIAAVGVAAGALAVGATTIRTTALPPVTDTDLVAPVASSPVIRDTARYVLVDLDRDGTPEMVALAEGAAGPELVVVDAVTHRRIARIPFGTPGNPCASEFTVEGNQLIVNDYVVPEFGDSACQIARQHHYLMHEHALVTFDF